MIFIKIVLFYTFKNTSAFLLRDARHAMHDILLLRISAILPEAISDGRLTPTTDTDLLLATYRGVRHFTSDIFTLVNFSIALLLCQSFCMFFYTILFLYVYNVHSYKHGILLFFKWRLIRKMILVSNTDEFLLYRFSHRYPFFFSFLPYQPFFFSGCIDPVMSRCLL